MLFSKQYPNQEHATLCTNNEVYHSHFCLTLLASQLTEATTETALLDSTGDEVRPGVNYYIVSTFRSSSGLTLGRRNGTCPLTVKQAAWLHDGLRLRFYPVDPEAKVVTLNKDMNVAFWVLPPLCRQSTVWKMRTDEATGKAYVGTGGVIGKPGPRTFDNWFKIVKEERSGDFKLVFCPDVSPFGRIICGDLGFFLENGERWLGLVEPPFQFVLRKA